MRRNPGKSIPLSICLLLTAANVSAKQPDHLECSLIDKQNAARLLNEADIAEANGQLERRFSLVKQAANGGNCIAQFDLAKAYYLGRGTPKNLPEGIRLLTLAAEAGVPEAQYFLGEYVLKYSGVQGAPATAARWFDKAANFGVGNAQYQLGRMYAVGHGVSQDVDRAIDLLQRAARHGMAKAQLELAKPLYLQRLAGRDKMLAQLYELKASNEGKAHAALMLGLAFLNGDVFDKDVNEARKWLLIAGEEGSGKGFHNLAVSYSRDEKGKVTQNKQAIRYLRRASALDYLPSIAILARLYRIDPSNTEYMQRSIPLYEQAVRLGHAEMTHEFGAMYYMGRTVEKDQRKGLALFERAANAGYANSQTLFGTYLLRMDSTRRDEAKNLLKRAAAQGYPEGQFQLAMLKLAKDPNSVSAAKLLDRAANKGHIPALARLGRMHLYGQAVERNLRLARAYLETAASKGDVNGEFYLAHALRRKILSVSTIGAAMALLKRAAGKGHPDALFELSRVYELGDGVKVDLEKSVDLLLKAEKAGSGYALLRIANMNFETLDTPNIRRQAYIYYTFAYRIFGDNHALGVEALRKLRIVEGRLPPKELSEARKSADELYPVVLQRRGDFDM